MPSDDKPSGEKVARALSFEQDPKVLKEKLKNELAELEALLQKRSEVAALGRMGAKSKHDVDDTREKTPARHVPAIHTTKHVRRDSSGKLPCPILRFAFVFYRMLPLLFKLFLEQVLRKAT